MEKIISQEKNENTFFKCLENTKQFLDPCGWDGLLAGVGFSYSALMIGVIIAHTSAAAILPPAIVVLPTAFAIGFAVAFLGRFIYELYNHCNANIPPDLSDDEEINLNPINI